MVINIKIKTILKLITSHLNLFVVILIINWGFFLKPQFLYGEVFNIFNGESISSALKKVSKSDTLIIHKGDYSENVIINISIVMIGKGFPHIKGNYKGHVLLIKAPGTIIDGLEISESGTRLIDDLACIRVEADSVTIRNNIIKRPLHGIYVKGGSHTVIESNTIEGRLDLISADRGNGIHLWNSRHNILFNNQIFNVRDGIYFSFADSTEVYQNHIHNVRYGLHNN